MKTLSVAVGYHIKLDDLHSVHLEDASEAADQHAVEIAKRNERLKTAAANAVPRTNFLEEIHQLCEETGIVAGQDRIHHLRVKLGLPLEGDYPVRRKS